MAYDNEENSQADTGRGGLQAGKTLELVAKQHRNGGDEHKSEKQGKTYHQNFFDPPG